MTTATRGFAFGAYAVEHPESANVPTATEEIARRMCTASSKQGFEARDASMIFVADSRADLIRSHFVTNRQKLARSNYAVLFARTDHSKGNTRFQSRFMSTTIQPRF